MHFGKKCLRTDNWTIWIKLPNSRVLAIKLPATTNSREALSSRRYGILCIDKASNWLAKLIWSMLSSVEIRICSK